MRIAIIVGSIRPGRKGSDVGAWVLEQARQRGDADYELVELADYDLPLLCEEVVPGSANRQYQTPQTRVWGAKIDEFDAYVFVSPEYNHGVPASLKNAFDVLYPEWVNKAVALVGYGFDGGVRATEHWRQIVANPRMHAVRAQLSLLAHADFDGNSFTPGDRRPVELKTVLDQLVALSNAVASLRE